MTADKFIQFVEKELAKKSIKLVKANKRSVTIEANCRVNGYFDEDEKVLSVAVKKPLEDWFPIFVHEYAHFLQWREKAPIWHHSFFNGIDRCDTIFLWVKHKKRFSLKDVKLHTARTRDIEVDCEKRAVKLIHKYKLPINYLIYTSQANSYLYFYNYAVLKRRWWKKGHAPYNNPDCWCNFPPFFKKRYTQLPKRYIAIYDKYC